MSYAECVLTGGGERIVIMETIRHKISLRVVNEIDAIKAWRWDNTLAVTDPNDDSDYLHGRQILADYGVLHKPVGLAFTHIVEKLRTNGNPIKWNRSEEIR